MRISIEELLALLVCLSRWLRYQQGFELFTYVLLVVRLRVLSSKLGELLKRGR